jgi:hypothetical protein
LTGSAIVADEEGLWPELPWREWEPTISTVHMWAQVVGKVRMALAPPLNHWWHTTLYVTSRGLTTSPIPYRDRMFQVDFDFIDHRLEVTDTVGRSLTIPLVAQSVARFHREFMDGLHSLDIDVRIWTKPVEVAEAIPFELDDQHHTYDPGHAHLFWRGLLQAQRVMKEFQTGFVGKASPVQFFWGGFDLAATRYSGRPAPLHPGGVPNCPTWVMEEAYCREESSVGWWPLSDAPGPSFYAYTYPEPDGFRTAPAGPPAAFFDDRFREFLLPYDAVRRSADPDARVLEFFQATYEAGADLGGWDRATLEPAVRPDRPPRRPWSMVGGDGDGGDSPGGAYSRGAGDRGARKPA